MIKMLLKMMIKIMTTNPPIKKPTILIVTSFLAPPLASDLSDCCHNFASDSSPNLLHSMDLDGFNSFINQLTSFVIGGKAAKADDYLID